VRAIGLDISLTSTGYADVQSIGREYSLTSTAFKTIPANENPSLLDRHNRARTIEDDIIRRIFAGPVPDLVAVEAPSYGSKFGDPHDRSGLWWGIVDRCLRAGLLVVEISPSQVKMYATGSGSGRGATKVTKAMVVAAVNDRYEFGPIRLRVSDHDQADAIVLAALAARLAGHPIDPHIPPANLRAITNIRLPEGMTL